ncbi:MAG TPA: hypothetical protein VJU18_09430 [Vicinamibacteria bacterium]|nr:hypothetical protein [Vicinamibacteria bacterium]
MANHLTDERLIDLLEETAGAETRRHAEECRPCQVRLQDARAGLKLAQSAEVPEPSPLYWEHFRRQVGHRLEAAQPRRWPRLAWGGLLATAAAALVLAVWMPGTPSGGRGTAQLPAWSALPPSDGDQGLAILAVIAPQASEELGVVADCHDVGNCLAELSDEESQALAEALRGQFAKGGTS